MGVRGLVQPLSRVGGHKGGLVWRGWAGSGGSIVLFKLSFGFQPQFKLLEEAAEYVRAALGRAVRLKGRRGETAYRDGNERISLSGRSVCEKGDVCEFVGCQGFSSITPYTAYRKQSLLEVSDVIFTAVTKIW